MPDIGRFFNIDPLSEKYAYQSHYNFSENRVVNSREIEGLEAFDGYDDPYEWGDRVGLDRDNYHIEWKENGRSELIQDIEEVVITKSFDWDHFFEGLDLGLDLVGDFLNIGFDNHEDFDFNYKMGGAGRGLEGTGRDYEGIGDDLLREGDRVHAFNMDDFLTPTPSPNGLPDGFGYKFTWGFSAGAESFKNAMDLADKMGDKPGDTLINVETTKESQYGEHGIKLEDTVISVTVEKNDMNDYGYTTNPYVREAIDNALHDKK